MVVNFTREGHHPESPSSCSVLDEKVPLDDGSVLVFRMRRKLLAVAPDARSTAPPLSIEVDKAAGAQEPVAAAISISAADGAGKNSAVHTGLTGGSREPSAFAGEPSGPPEE